MGWSSGMAGSRSSKSGPRSQSSAALLSSSCSIRCNSFLCVASPQTFKLLAQQPQDTPSLTQITCHSQEILRFPCCGPVPFAGASEAPSLGPPPGHWSEGRVPQKNRQKMNRKKVKEDSTAM